MTRFLRLIIFVVSILWMTTALAGAEDAASPKEVKHDAIDVFYQQGVDLYKQGAYIQAKEKFLKVQKYHPEYQGTELFLQRIQDNLDYEKVKKQQESQSTFQQRQATMRENEQRAEEIQKKLQRAQLSEKKWSEKYEQLEVEKVVRTRQQLEKQIQKAAAERHQQEAKLAAETAQEQRRLEKEKQAILKKGQKDELLAKAAEQREEKRHQQQERQAQLEQQLQDKKKQKEEHLAQLVKDREEKLRQQQEQVEQLKQQREEQKQRAQERLVQLKKEQEEQRNQEQERLAKLREEKEAKVRQQQEQAAQEKAVQKAMSSIATTPAKTVAAAQLISPVKEQSIPKVVITPIKPSVEQHPSGNRKELTQKAQDLYREISASYKAGQYVYALDKTEELRKILVAEELQENFKKDMSKKVDKIEAKYSSVKEKVAEPKEQASAPKSSRLLDIYGEEAGLGEDAPEEARVPASASAEGKSTEPDSHEQYASLPPAKQSEPEVSAPVKSVSSSSEKTTDNKPAAVPPSAGTALTPQDHLQQKLTQKVDSLYRDGLEFYRSGSYDMARKVLLQVDKLWPDYKLTKMYLNIIDHELANHKVQSVMAQRNKKDQGLEKTDVISQTLDEYEQ